MDIEFIPSESIPVKGKKADIIKMYGEKYLVCKHGEGHGNFLLTRKADARINGVSYRDYILNLYGKSRLTESLVNRFKKDLEDGKLTLEEIDLEDDEFTLED